MGTTPNDAIEKDKAYKSAPMHLRQYQENGLSEFVTVSRYARFRPDLGRRETWREIVDRVRSMHRRFFSRTLTKRPDLRILDELEENGALSASSRRVVEEWGSLNEEIDQAFSLVEQKAILPSMRSLQFGGQAIESSHARLYNCSFSFASRPAFFSEAFFLLLSGVGVGFSVQWHHVRQLPTLASRGPQSRPAVRFTIPDSIEGWAQAVDRIIRGAVDGYRVEFDYSQIRPPGTPLKTSGGTAPGHKPLQRALKTVGALLNEAAGRQLRPIEVYDIMMHLSRAVLSGGVRRAASICLFSHDDTEMAKAKTGNWLEDHPQRAFSNNSAVLHRESTDKPTYLALFEHQKQFGEPGFHFTSDLDFGCNPCGEVGLFPRLSPDPEEVERLRELGLSEPIKPGQPLQGWQMCNLTTINGKQPATRNEFLRLCRYAAVLGTLQAAYTDIPFLGPVSRVINERDGLLGVSICGILDNPEILLDAEILEFGARVVRATNALIAGIIGINRAARATCVKPEGTASLLLDTSPGIHPHHARHYFRRIQANRAEPVYRFFRRYNAHMTEPSVYNPEADDVITFPVEAPPKSLVRDDLTAVELLEKIALVQRSWIEAGRSPSSPPEHQHNVSHTIAVAEEEWEDVAEYIWSHRHTITGTALVPRVGDKIYPQAPNEAVQTEKDVERWNRLVYVPVDYTQLRETEDLTQLREVPACSGIPCRVNSPY